VFWDFCSPNNVGLLLFLNENSLSKTLKKYERREPMKPAIDQNKLLTWLFKMLVY
jgi:hypothetical protein